MNSSKFKSFIIKIAILLGVAGFLLLLNKFYFHIQPIDIKSWTEALGAWGPLVFMILFLIRPFTLFPFSVIAVTCGVTFGPYWGTVYILVGMVLSTAVSFYVLRRFAKEINIEGQGRENLRRLKEDVEKQQFKAVLMLRLLPAINFDLLTYICAKTRVEGSKHLIATLVGMLPSSIMLGVFGSGLLAFKPVNLLVLAGLIIVLTILAVVMKRNVGDRYDTEKLKTEVKDLRKSI
ncbi:TVP38/TMEM64 family protein [Halobacillus naozhouensis]|uniref:TVP38/TMEM64 family membrane protein n=1 Tax=Halobacillus naozhouensis TaxID=554880 RepID=A0ABY8IZ86_9BACI|nr:TVP38/TMEM64 family protein [Halobacillus naozhouensis]WFT75528.1 TVP38/TMEM64 family protein [Halobacillus naozhouensis]